MAPLRFFRTGLIGLFLFLIVPVNAQPVDTLVLRARADSLQQEGLTLFQNSELEAAANCFLEAAQIREKILGVMTAECANSYNGLANSYMFLGDLEQALVYYEKSLNIRREVLGERHPDYATSLSNIGLCYMNLGDYDKTINYYEQALRIRREVLGELHPDYAVSLNNIGNCRMRLGDFEEALALFKQSIAIFGEQHPNNATILNNIGGCYYHLGNYDEALVNYTKALETCREVLGEYHPTYSMILNNLGSYYYAVADYGNATDCFTKALEIIKDLYGEHHPQYAVSLDNLGNVYSELGDNEKAVKYYLKALEIQREIYGEKHPDYAAGLQNLGAYYISLNDYDKAIEYCSKALEIQREVFGEEHPEYIMGLTNLGSCYRYLGDYDKAVECLAKAMEISRTVLGEHHPVYATNIFNLGCYYLDLADYDKAVDCFRKAEESYRVVLGEHHPDYARSLYNLGKCYREQGDKDGASTHLRAYASLVSDLVLEAFTYLPQGERSMYWDLYSYFFTDYLPQAARFLSSDKPFLCATYNGALFSKGLLLNAETELRRLILESGDEEALSLYDQLLAERLQLDALYEIPVSERPMPTDSLEQLCASLERELQQQSKTFGDYTKNLSINWKDVQSSLEKRDIAIEFLKVPVSEDTTVYCALTLKRDYDAPHYVELFDLKELDALKAKYTGLRNSEGLIHGDKALYDLVWKPLEKELKGVKNIYFGPSGDLYQTAIEYADNGKGPFAGQKNIFRLSSTRQLAASRGETERRRSAVFGGLKYGASEEVLLADSRKYAQRSIPEDLFFSVDSLIIRGAGGSVMVADLPGTESEAREIDALLRKEGLDNTLRMGEEGTEAAFKDLSGRHENIIHVATHGFYWNGQQAQEDASMTRSGLLFSGANNALKKGYVRQEGVEDGILTAQEIARLDLRGADLLVLSACQTGLGAVSGEGVFGLQRGFKKAGVNSILMSLWEVDDEATQLLMTQFYKGLTRGLSKTDALKAAQAAVRANKSRDFSSPYYWAAFILLDGKE